MNYIGARQTNRYLFAYGTAVLLHMLLFLFQSPIREVLLATRIPDQIESSTPPMLFEFVETSESDLKKTPHQPTPFVSERASVSKDLSESELPPSSLPHLDGLIASNELRTAIGKEFDSFDRNAGTAEKNQSSLDRSLYLQENPNAADAVSLSRDSQMLTQQQLEEAVYGKQTFAKSSLVLDNARSSALESGGLQLSTYDWDFAPYLKYLKHHIERHIFPPPAFTELGMIDGTTRVKFRILPDGKLEALKLIDFEGSVELRDTSVRAVELSADFRPLPEHFPEEYLEITGTFQYFIYRQSDKPQE